MIVEIAEFILDGLAGEELLACGEVVFGDGEVKVAIGFFLVAVAEDEAEGVGRAEAAVSSVLFKEVDADFVAVAVSRNHSDSGAMRGEVVFWRNEEQMKE